jgi:hypothetical protein
MRTCPHCGARVTDGLAWCNQCYEALPAEGAVAASAAEPPLWIRSNVGRPARAEVAPEFSRWRGGATSFGPIGRSLLTLGVLMLLVVGYPMLRGLVFTVLGVDVPGSGFILMYVCVAIPAGAYLLSRVWKRERVA